MVMQGLHGGTPGWAVGDFQRKPNSRLAACCTARTYSARTGLRTLGYICAVVIEEL